MKCGSMNPSTTRRSASTYARFIATGSPSIPVPAGTRDAGSCESWFTTR